MVRNGLVIVVRIDRCYSLKFRSCCHFYHSHCHYKLLIICRLHEMLKMTATYNKTIFYIISGRIKIPKLAYPYLFSCKENRLIYCFVYQPIYLSVVLSGFEPLQTEPKPVVLPLHHRTIAGAKIMLFWFTHKLFVEKLQKFIPFLYLYESYIIDFYS